MPLSESDKYATQSHLDDNFPGLIYKLENKQFLDEVVKKEGKEKKMVALIFSSGKVVFTGADKKEQIEKAYKSLHEVLDGYKKTVNDYQT